MSYPLTPPHSESSSSERYRPTAWILNDTVTSNWWRAATEHDIDVLRVIDGRRLQQECPDLLESLKIQKPQLLLGTVRGPSVSYTHLRAHET